MFSFAPIIDTEETHVFALVEQGKSCGIKSLKTSAEIRVVGASTPTPTHIQANAETLTLTVTGRVIITGNITLLHIASAADVEIILDQANIDTIKLQNPTADTLINFTAGSVRRVQIKNRSLSFGKLALVGNHSQNVLVHLQGSVGYLVLSGALYTLAMRAGKYPKTIRLDNSGSYMYHMHK